MPKLFYGCSDQDTSPKTARAKTAWITEERIATLQKVSHVLMNWPRIHDSLERFYLNHQVVFSQAQQLIHDAWCNSIENCYRLGEWFVLLLSW